MEVELSFQQRMKELEERFSVDQESVEKRFQADILRLEQDYQSELQAMSTSHTELRLSLEAHLQEALENVEKERRMAEETIVEERERLDKRREEDQHELEKRCEERVKDLAAINQQLQQEVDTLVGEAQTKEIKLSKQLNELHGRLQESLEAREQLLAQSERKPLDSEVTIRIGQERDDLKGKVEELEMLLRQAAIDFELERKELQEEVTILEKRLNELLESNKQDLVPGHALNDSFEQFEVDEVLSPAGETNMLNKEENGIDDLKKVEDVRVEIYEDGNSGRGDVPDPTASEEQLLTYLPKDKDLQPEGHQDVGGAAETHCCSPGIFSSCTNTDPDNFMLSVNRFGIDALGESASTQMLCDLDSGVQQSKGENVDVGGENRDAPESCGEERKPQDVLALEDNGAPPENERSHETAVGTQRLQESCDPPEMFPVDFEVPCVLHNSHEPRWEAEPPTAARVSEELTHEGVKPPNKGANCEGGGCPLVALQLLYNTAAGENVLLREKASLLQQKTQVLEDLLAQSGDKIQASRLAFEENHGLKVQVLLLLDHVRQLELKALGVTHLQVRYEDCTLENTRLKRHNRQLERRIWSLEDGPSVFHDLQTSKVNARMRDGRTAMLCGLEGRGLTGCDGQLQAEAKEAVDLQGCCSQLERQNWGLRRALTELQDQSQALDRSTLAQR